SAEVGPITVSTLKEAEAFADAGFKDIFIAVGTTGSKLARAGALLERGVDLKIAIDSVEAARQVADMQSSGGAAFQVCVEINCGDGRGGIAPHSDALLEIARVIGSSSANLQGVFTHAGQSYGARSNQQFIEIATQERDAVLLAAKRLREGGFDCATVSVGSSPTARFAEDVAGGLSGITEMRPGVYMFQDLYQLGLGVCDVGDLAVSVLASVIGHHQERNLVLIDAGGLALSKDRSCATLDVDPGYGWLSNEAGDLLDDVLVSATSQEHGWVTTGSGEPLKFDAFPIGARVRVWPNHVCMTAAAFDGYFVLGADGQPNAWWPRINGW
ncbi:MAG: alanine racemase, partial [Rhodospirillaceae bacterium]|nr:alanine racemase [Rhodospirillaceae bacterium]